MFQAELETIVRQEVRKGASGSIYLWPTRLGENVVVTGPTCRVLYQGTEIATPSVTEDGPTDPNPPNDPLASKLVVLVDAATLQLSDRYTAIFSFTVDGDAVQESVGFDVVVEPAGSFGVSLNELVSEQADIAAMLERQAEQQADDRDANDQAALLAVSAWGYVRALLKKKVIEAGGIWPAFVVNKEELRPVVTAEAIRRAFVAQGMTSEAIIALEGYWARQRDQRFAALPPIEVSSDEDREAETIVQSFGIVETERRW